MALQAARAGTESFHELRLLLEAAPRHPAFAGLPSACGEPSSRPTLTSIACRSCPCSLDLEAMDNTMLLPNSQLNPTRRFADARLAAKVVIQPIDYSRRHPSARRVRRHPSRRT